MSTPSSAVCSDSSMSRSVLCRIRIGVRVSSWNVMSQSLSFVNARGAALSVLSARSEEYEERAESAGMLYVWSMSVWYRQFLLDIKYTLSVKFKRMDEANSKPTNVMSRSFLVPNAYLKLSIPVIEEAWKSMALLWDVVSGTPNVMKSVLCISIVTKNWSNEEPMKKKKKDGTEKSTLET